MQRCLASFRLRGNDGLDLRTTYKGRNLFPPGLQNRGPICSSFETGVGRYGIGSYCGTKGIGELACHAPLRYPTNVCNYATVQLFTPNRPAQSQFCDSVPDLLRYCYWQRADNVPWRVFLDFSRRCRFHLAENALR